MSDTLEETEVSLRDQIKSAITEVNEPEEGDDLPEVIEKIEEKPRDETGKFKKAEEVIEKEIDDPAPASLSGPMKAKWKELPQDVRAEWSKRENDIHKMFTAHDGELRLGREMKDVISPYIPIIQAEGGTPVKAVSDLLNTAYVLRTGTPEQKANLLYQVAQQYGVDLGKIQSPQYTDPTIKSLQDEIQQLKQQTSPEVIEKQLQERIENARIQSEVNAFAADTSKIHFEQVKADMAALLGNGRAKDLQEAYDMACWARPEIRSTLLESQEAKKKEEIANKKKAAVSLTGSPGVFEPNSTPPNRSLRDEIKANIQAARSSRI